MPGNTIDSRILASLAAYGLLLEIRHDTGLEAFDQHIRRLRAYLESGVLVSIPQERRDLVIRFLGEGDNDVPFADLNKNLAETTQGSDVDVQAIWNKLDRLREMGSPS